jgi:hypothetical protein
LVLMALLALLTLRVVIAGRIRSFEAQRVF